MNNGKIYYRRSLVSLIAPVCVITTIIVVIIMCFTLPTLIMEGVCNSSFIKEVYDRIFYDLPASSVVCYFDNIVKNEEMSVETKELSLFILLIGTFIFFGLIISMMMTIYRMITIYLSILYHFIKRMSEREKYVISCITNKEYRDKLIWNENKRHSYVMVSVCFTIYFTTNLLTRENKTRAIAESMIFIIPIIYFVGYDIYKTVMSYRDYKKMHEDNFV